MSSGWPTPLATSRHPHQRCRGVLGRSDGSDQRGCVRSRLRRQRQGAVLPGCRDRAPDGRQRRWRDHQRLDDGRRHRRERAGRLRRLQGGHRLPHQGLDGGVRPSRRPGRRGRARADARPASAAMGGPVDTMTDVPAGRAAAPARSPRQSASSHPTTPASSTGRSCRPTADASPSEAARYPRSRRRTVTDMTATIADQVAEMRATPRRPLPGRRRGGVRGRWVAQLTTARACPPARRGPGPCFPTRRCSMPTAPPHHCEPRPPPGQR